MIEIILLMALTAIGGFFIGGIQFGSGMFIGTALMLFWLAIRDNPRRVLGRTETTIAGSVELVVVPVVIALLAMSIGSWQFSIGLLISMAIMLVMFRTYPRLQTFADKLGNKPQSKVDTAIVNWDEWLQKQVAKADREKYRLLERATSDE